MIYSINGVRFEAAMQIGVRKGKWFRTTRYSMLASQASGIDQVLAGKDIVA
jgi:hypothetical protein